MDGYNYVYNVALQDFDVWLNPFFNQNFLFEFTWKGRMFYLFFIWLLFIESIICWDSVIDMKPKKRLFMMLSIICTLIPTIYIVATSFLGLDLTILRIGFNLGVRSVTPEGKPWDFLYLQWPLSCEYLMLSLFFLIAIVFAYGLKGLRFFSISLAFITGVSVAYMFDTIYPFGLFRPLQELALPTAATTAAIFDILGYRVSLNFPVYYEGSALPSLTIKAEGRSASVIIAWACAGVHSLLLYMLIISVFFKRVKISNFRKLAYFITGLFGTYLVNVFRIFSILVTMLNHGRDAGMYFHNTYAELYFFAWIFSYIALITLIQKFMLIERMKWLFRESSLFLKSKLRSS